MAHGAALRWCRRLLPPAVAAVALAGCASLVNWGSADVALRTHPEAAHCDLSGRDGYSASVETPAVVSIPRSAAPVTVTCQAPGFRRTVASLNDTSSGWVWGNSALIIVTGGAAALGLVVDEALGSDWTYPKDMNVELEQERVREIHTRSRGDGRQLRLEAR